MLGWLKGALEIMGMLLLVGIASSLAPMLGAFLCLIVLVVAGFAILRPLPGLRLPSRGYNFAVFALVGFLGMAIPGAFIHSERDRELATLKKTDPAAYMVKLEQTDKERWLKELATFDPKRFALEQVASTVKKAKAEEEARIATEREAANAAAMQAQKELAHEAAATEKVVADLASYKEGILSNIATGDWGHAEFFIPYLAARGGELEPFIAEVEAQAVAKVKALPASDLAANRDGYKFLTSLRPAKSEYATKAQDYRAKIDNERKAVVARLIPEEDKVEGITFYHHPNEPKFLNSRSTAFLYIGNKGVGGQPWLRMKVQYTSSEWLFVEGVYAWFDGIKEPLILGPFDRDNNSTIWEWRDVSPDGRQLLTLESLANAKEAILRFEGQQYRRDVTLSEKDKKALRDVLAAYQVMNGGT